MKIFFSVNFRTLFYNIFYNETGNRRSSFLEITTKQNVYFMANPFKMVMIKLTLRQLFIKIFLSIFINKSPIGTIYFFLHAIHLSLLILLMNSILIIAHVFWWNFCAKNSKVNDCIIKYKQLFDLRDMIMKNRSITSQFKIILLLEIIILLKRHFTWLEIW